MNTKLISTILVFSLLNLLGCYSFESIQVSEYKQVEEKVGKPGEIKVKTKNSQEYHFTESDFFIHSDTLYGKISVNEVPFEGKFSLSEIESIQLLTPDRNLLFASVSEYLKSEAENGKPDFIYTKLGSNRYHFMKNDYHIEDDTLYGKGKLLLFGQEELIERKIALSDIQSFEIDSFNLTNTILLGLGIVVFLTAVAVVAFILGMRGMK
jgi:hypothetical protein